MHTPTVVHNPRRGGCPLSSPSKVGICRHPTADVKVRHYARIKFIWYGFYGTTQRSFPTGISNSLCAIKILRREQARALPCIIYAVLCEILRLPCRKNDKIAQEQTLYANSLYIFPADSLVAYSVTSSTSYFLTLPPKLNSITSPTFTS